jgi:hypothetical protein
MSRAVDAKSEPAAALNLTLIKMILVTTLTRRLSYQLSIAAWGFTLALRSCQMFDLNKLPAEYFGEAFHAEHPMQYSTLSPPRRRARLSDDQVGPSNSGKVPLGLLTFPSNR